MRILVDTNILIRLTNIGDPDHSLAEAAIHNLRKQKFVAFMVPQNLYEYWAVATRPIAVNGLGLSATEAAVEVANFKRLFFICEDEPQIRDAWEFLVTTHAVVGKTSHDARIVAAMKVHGMVDILTFNKPDFQRFPGINVITPQEAVAMGIP